MAAQKLTKARLAQILIMLSVLIGAFFWRTFTYDKNREVDCTQKQRCEFVIGAEKIIINKKLSGISIEGSKKESLKIDLNQSGDFIIFNNKNRNIGWNLISENKKINLKLNELTVQVNL
ncbi:hypothetical protein [Vibrio sp. AND4]|uniref:hypothetical protein n=1 Tax=Vibrio sp. AND4 TaxID=314289 RepID=UPI00015EFA9B|nr:hypothetical protein [Vibrio sp. AND4]EDP60043.1 hypothetical protein AND4_01503 [Vibrio sp. AND4]